MISTGGPWPSSMSIPKIPAMCNESAYCRPRLIGGTQARQVRWTIGWFSASVPTHLPQLNCDIVSLSKVGGPAASPRREREKSATKTCDSILHEGAEFGSREPLLRQHG